MMTLASILAALVLVFGGSGMTVYAAQDSLPSDFLYPLKLQLEELRLDLNTEPVKEVWLMTAFANHRADEIVQLANQGEEIPAGLVTQLETQLNTMMEMVANLDPDTAEVCLLQVRQNLRTRDQVRSMTAMPEDVNPPLMQLQHTLQFHHRLAEIGVDDPLEFRNQFRFQQDGNAGPPEEVTETPVVTDTPTETVEPPEETPGPPYGPQDGNCQDGETCEPVGDQNGPQNGKDESGPPAEGEEPPHGNQNGDCDQDCEPIGTGQPDDAGGNGQGTSQPTTGQDSSKSGNGGNQDNSGGTGKNK